MGDCQNYGPFLGPYYNTGPNTGPNLGDPKRDHNFDNLPYHPCNPCSFHFLFPLSPYKPSTSLGLYGDNVKMETTI